jgi:uncharacterized protein
MASSVTDSTPTTAALREKQDRLDERLRCLGSVLVAYSGGVDSAFLAWSAHRVLGPGMRAVIADSPSLARSHLTAAIEFARCHGIALDVIPTHELDNPAYAKNDAQRCFHCKNELFTVMEQARQRLKFQHLAYGMNTDDRGDFRPGQTAARNLGVLAPLADAGLGKADIRALALAAGLDVWDKPASACLSSRLEYGRPVTRDRLQQIEAGEERLRELGFRQFRVRHHGEIARIEIDRTELAAATTPEMLAIFSAAFKALGFLYVTLDCEGFRSGSMNAVLPAPSSVHAHRLP